MRSTKLDHHRIAGSWINRPPQGRSCGTLSGKTQPVPGPLQAAIDLISAVSLSV